jgi:hypothetical protein
LLLLLPLLSHKIWFQKKVQGTSGARQKGRHFIILNYYVTRFWSKKGSRHIVRSTPERSPFFY